MNFEAERRDISIRMGNPNPIIRERGPVYLKETPDPEPDYDGYSHRGDDDKNDEDDIYNLN